MITVYFLDHHGLQRTFETRTGFIKLVAEGHVLRIDGAMDVAGKPMSIGWPLSRIVQWTQQ